MRHYLLTEKTPLEIIIRMKEINYRHPLAEKIRREITRGLSDYEMIRPGDKILVAVSGGKDSTVLALLLNEIKRIAPFDFTVDLLMIDQKQPGFNADNYKKYISDLGHSLTILQRDTYSIVMEKVPEGSTYCALCSRLRRGILYRYARENGYDKIALGHHRDDLLETLLMNIFYEGRISSMPPKLLSDDGTNTVIRPMVYVAEKDIIALSGEWDIPVIPCGLCGSQEGLKRDQMRDLLDDLEKKTPDIRSSVLHALQTVRESQLMDHHLWNFKDLDREKKTKEFPDDRAQ